ncbi:MAG: DNA-formamidopyrimidine glycosylase [Bacilli bacterium]
MPELPEVEAVRQSIGHLIVNRTILDFVCLYEPMLKSPTEVHAWCDALIGEQIQVVERYGKHLFIQTSKWEIAIHLRMEGKLRVYDQKQLDKHTHILFKFDNNTWLHYNDVRKFGTFHLYRRGERQNQHYIAKLGKEPHASDWQTEELAKLLHKTNRPIKVALLDQQLVCGLGNIYVDEVLFASGIAPERLASSLTMDEVDAIRRSMKTVIDTAIENGGTTIRSYENSHGKKGTYQQQLKVYGRSKQHCLLCGNEIQKIKLAGRGTHWCSTCQN